MFKIIINILKAAMFLVSLWKEKDAEKAKEKQKLGIRIVSAFKETNKDKQASRLSAIINDIRSM